MKLRTGTYLDPGLCYQARITAGRRQNTQRRMTPLCIPRFFKKRVVLPRYYPESLVPQAFSFFCVSCPRKQDCTGSQDQVKPLMCLIHFSSLLAARRLLKNSILKVHLSIRKARPASILGPATDNEEIRNLWM